MRSATSAMCNAVLISTRIKCKVLAYSGTPLKRTPLEPLLCARNMETPIFQSFQYYFHTYLAMYKTLYRQAFGTMHIHPENVEVHNLESPEKEVPL